MLEAQRLAKEEKHRITMAKRALYIDGRQRLPDVISDPLGEDDLLVNSDNEDTLLDDDVYSSQNTTHSDKDIETDYKDLEPLRILQAGPYKWTSDITNEYINKFKSLEGKLYAHPRTRRIYEITTIFFHPVKKVAAAYSRIVDGGQPDVHDLYPSRIEGELGLEELVKLFESTGGSTGESKTKWPDSAESWATELNKDITWGPKLKSLQLQLLEKRALAVKNGQTKEAALKDTYINPIFKEYDKVKFKYNGLLYMLSAKEGDDKTSHQRHRLVVPHNLHKNILELYHDTKGHPGSIRTRDTIFLHYWWPQMTRDVDRHCKSCLACARRKSKGATGAVDIQTYSAPDTPWARTHMDLTGPIHTSKTGYSYILVVKDSSTIYVETIPLKSKTKEDIAEALVREIICRYGGFGHLITDSGDQSDQKTQNSWITQITQLMPPL